MTALTKTKEGCTTQLLSTETPTSDWDLERLGQHAQALHEQIETKEQALPAVYWHLGQTLMLARRHFQHGQWQKFLGEHGIDKTRASRAKAIHRSFECVEDLTGLTVKEAYAARKECEEVPPRRTEARHRNSFEEADSPLPETLKQWLDDFAEKGSYFADETEFTTADEATELIERVDQAVAQLNALRELLQRRVKPKLLEDS